MIKKILSIIIATATVLSLFCCIPAMAGYASTPYVYCDFNDATDSGFFYAGYNSSGEDSIIDGVAGSAGAFQRRFKWNADADGGFLVSSKVAFPTEWFYGKVKVSFWFKIDPTVGTILTTNSPDGNLSTMHPRFYVSTDLGGKNKEIQGNKWTKTGWDIDALNRGEWIFLEMIGDAGGVINGYELKADDVMKLEIRPNAASNITSHNLTSTGEICFAVDDFKVEKVIDAYDSEAEDAAEYAYPWAEELAISGDLESNGAWGTHYGNSDNVKAGNTISADNKVTLSYTYNSNDKATAEGSSLVRVMRETAAGSNEYAVIKQFTRTDSNSFEYQLSEDWIGRRMKMEVVPVNAKGVCGAPYSVVSEPVKSSTDPSIRLSFDESTETGSGRFFMGRTDATDTSVRGAVGSGAALKREATISSSCPSPFLQHVFTANPKELFMGNFKISLWFKLNADVTQLNTDSTKGAYVDRLFIVLQNNSDKSSWNLHIPFPEGSNVNDGEWMHLEFDAYETNRFNGASANLNTAADDQDYTMTIRLGMGYSNLNNSDIITSEGNVLSYCIDDFRIEKIVDSYSGSDSTYGRPYVTEASVTGNMVSGSVVDVDYNYNIDRTANTESDNSVIRVLRETAVGSNMYGLVKSYTKKEFLEEGYTLTDAWLDKKMKVEITPVAADGTYGATYTTISDPVKPEYQVATVISDLSGNNVSATASVLNNYRDGEDDPLVLIIAVYDVDGRMIRCEIKDFTVPNTVATAQTAVATTAGLPVTLTDDELANADKIKALLWNHDGTYIPVADEKFIDVN